MIKRAVPELFAAFEAIRPLLMTDQEARGIRTLYAKTKPSNFSHEVLLKANGMTFPSTPVTNVLWSDLGDPSRVSSTPAWHRFSNRMGKPQPVSYEVNTSTLIVSQRHKPTEQTNAKQSSSADTHMYVR